MWMSCNWTSISKLQGNLRFHVTASNICMGSVMYDPECLHHLLQLVFTERPDGEDLIMKITKTECLVAKANSFEN